MGNTCVCVCRQTDEDEAADALLDGFEAQQSRSPRPRGPPPPYQVEAPLYAMSEEQRVQLVQRVTMIQSLPLGRYDVGEEGKEGKEGVLESSEEVQGCEKKGEKDRECPICMVDFVVGEHIRLLPCMHFYHMRCIDEWLLRSYCCPSCMERVDVGMHHTLTSVGGGGSSSSHHHHGLRRRRRRRDRGSSSSAVSVEAGPEPRGAGQDAKRREFAPRLLRHSSSGHGNYLTDQSVPGRTGQSGHDSVGQVEGASAQFLDDPPEFEVRPPLSQDELAYSMHSITFNDAQITNTSPQQQGGEHLSTPSPVGATPPGDVGVVPFSPPVFEYHFEYPSTQ